MTSDFLHLAINDHLSQDLDPVWRSRIEAAFPYPYITRAEAADDTYAYTAKDIETALDENIAAARRERTEIIKHVPLLDTIGAMTILGTRAAVDAQRAAQALIVVEDHGNWLYPAFQFDPATLLPYPVIKDLNIRFARKEINHWGELAWWVSKNPHLNNESPASLLQSGRGEDLRALFDSEV